MMGRPGVGTGRRARLKISWPAMGRAGSIPALGTSSSCHLERFPGLSISIYDHLLFVYGPDKFAIPVTSVPVGKHYKINTPG